MERETKITLDSLKMEKKEKNEGIEFFYKFFQLIKNAYIHNINNKALQFSARNFKEITNELIQKEGTIIFQYKDNSLFYNKNRIKFSSEEFEYAKDLFKFFEEKEIGSIIFNKNLNEGDIFNFLSIFIYSKIKDFNKLKEKIKEVKLPISIEKAKKGEGSFKKLDLDRRLYIFITYSKAIVLYENFLKKDLSHSKRSFILSKLLRIVQSFVDICKEDDNTFLSLSQIKNPEKPFPTHIINVMILAISLGEKIGLGRNKLFELGTSALYYDIGMEDMPNEVIKEGKRLTPQAGLKIQEHPFLSLQRILSSRSLETLNIYKAIVAFEHHISNDMDFSYPTDWEEPHLFSKIIKICDAYDSLTTQKQYRPAYLPDEALKLLAQNSSKYDLPLLKVFVNTVGVYPSGSFVKLNTGEKALVLLGGGSKERISKPVVEIIETKEIVDLLKDSEKRFVLSSVFPYDIDTPYSEILLGG